ncbi:MAG: O-antigen ligase family protein [Aeromicrobium sp.]|nr:O-antigen ligase family protein [Aeromicrobium sp.]
MTTQRSIDRHASVVLALVFACQIGGSFTLDRVSSSLPALDLRWVGLGACLVPYVGWLAATSSRPRARSTPGVGALLFVAWAGWLAVSGSWAPAGARVSDHVIDLVLVVAFVLLAGHVAGSMSREAVASLWTWFFVVGLVYFAAAILAGPGLQGRYSAFGGGPNVFVRVVLIALLAALFLAVGRRWWVLLAVPLFLAGAVLSGSRGGLVAFAIVMVVAAAPLLRRLPRRAIALIGVGAALVIALVPAIVTSVVTTIDERFIGQTLNQRYDSGRGGIAAETLRIFDEHLITGAGLDSYYAQVGQYVELEYPHNLVLATAADGGVVGLLLLAGAVAALGWSARRGPVSREALFLLLAGMFVLISSLFSGDYYDSRLMWFFLVLAAVEGRRDLTGGATQRARVSAEAAAPPPPSS